MEDHSDQFIREDTVANLIDVKRFFQDVLTKAATTEDKRCITLLHEALKKNKNITAMVSESGGRYM